MALGCRLNDEGFESRQELGIFTTASRRLWGPPNLLSSGNQELFIWG
jgi:hypothetical protein